MSLSHEPAPPLDEFWERFLALEGELESHNWLYINNDGDLEEFHYNHEVYYPWVTHPLKIFGIEYLILKELSRVIDCFI